LRASPLRRLGMESHGEQGTRRFDDKPRGDRRGPLPKRPDNAAVCVCYLCNRVGEFKGLGGRCHASTMGGRRQRLASQRCRGAGAFSFPQAARCWWLRRSAAGRRCRSSASCLRGRGQRAHRGQPEQCTQRLAATTSQRRRWWRDVKSRPDGPPGGVKKKKWPARSPSRSPCPIHPSNAGAPGGLGDASRNQQSSACRGSPASRAMSREPRPRTCRDARKSLVRKQWELQKPVGQRHAAGSRPSRSPSGSWRVIRQPARRRCLSERRVTASLHRVR